MRFKIKARVEQLKAMHTLMLSASDDNIYKAWITGGITDYPTETDFIFCAKDDKDYNKAFDLFVKLISKDGCRY